MIPLKYSLDVPLVPLPKLILDEVTDVLAGRLIDFEEDGAVRGMLDPKREN
mgnify:CR=1 FL=1